MILSHIRVNGIRAVADKFVNIPVGIIGAKVTFQFDDPRWDGLTKTAVFRGCVTRDVIMDDDTVIIPHETVERKGGKLYVGVYGLNSDGAIAIPTLWAEVGTIRDAADPSGDPSADPSLPAWEQVLRASREAAEESEQSAKISQQAAENSGKNADRAEKASTEANEAAEEAARLEAAAKESQQKAAQSEENVNQAEERISNAVKEAQGAASAAGAAANEAAGAANSAAGAANSASLAAESAANSSTAAKEAAEEARRIVDGADVVKSVNGQTPDENGNVQIEFGSGSGVEVTAKPGQLIRVKSVDEAGKPTAWEAVPWGWVEGGMVEILPETELPTETGEAFFISQPVKVTVGESYTVNYNGVEYPSVVLDNGDGTLIMVNASANIETLEGVVFVIQLDENGIDGSSVYGAVMPYDGATSVTLSIHQKSETIHPIPGKLLPEGVPYVEKGETVEILPETTLTTESPGEFSIPENAPVLEIGKSYTVKLNGTEYATVTIDSADVGISGGVAVANEGANLTTGEGAVFVLLYIEGTLTLMEMAGSTSLTISISVGGATIHKIDPRCLPDDVGGVKLFEAVFALSISGSDITATTEDTFAKIYANATAENTIVRGVGVMGTIKLFYSLNTVYESFVEFSYMEQSGDGFIAHFIRVGSDNTVTYTSKTV